jgi:hypothetical protein
MKIIAPAEDWKSAIDIDEDTAGIIKDMLDRIGVHYNHDDPEKLYVAAPAPVKPPKEQDGNGLVYPSGRSLQRHPENNAATYAPGNPNAAAPLVKAPYNTPLSKNFTLGEFAPKSDRYDGVRVHPDLVEALEQIRRKAGAVIHITSGYRPPAYNASVGGVPNSQHLDGLAADISSDALSAKALCAIAEEVIRDSGGVGYYPRHGFVHVDVRGYRARWTG